MTRWSATLVALCLVGAAACSSADEETSNTSPAPATSTEPDASADRDDVDRDDVDRDGAEDGSSDRGDDPASDGDPTDTGGETTPTTSVPPEAADEGLAAPDGDEPTVLGPLGSTEVELDTGDGTVQIGAGDVPDLIPVAFPQPDDLVVQIASDTDGSAGYSGVSRIGFDDLLQLYRDGLPAAGYDLIDDTVTAGSLAVLAFDGPDGSGEVVLSTPAPGGGTSVIVTFER